MIVWGGGASSTTNTGGKYDPIADAWIATSIAAGVLTPRTAHSSVWTGNEMIVWGGWISTGITSNDGAHYDPVTNAWTAAATTNAPSVRYDHTAIWTGSEMILWGGEDGSGTELGNGKRYRCVP
jgi:hypothetical protein